MPVIYLIMTILGGILEAAFVLSLAEKFDAWWIALLYISMRIARVCAEIAAKAKE